jgi:predicted transposase/invertase (TIGR01784 family)
MKLRIDPKVDYAFKKLFGSEENEDLLVDLLEAVLGEKINWARILNPFQPKETATDKLSILDIKAELFDGKLVNIEMQINVDRFYPARALYYLAKTYQSQLAQGEDYEKLKPTIGIHFLDGTLFRSTESYHSHFQMQEHHAPDLIFSDHLQLHIIELPKFGRSAQELEACLDRWCFFLRNAVELEVDQLPETLQTEPIKRAVEVLRVMSLNTLEEQLYEARLREQRDKSSSLKGAYMDGKDEGIAIGIQEGKSIGIQEGKSIGIQEGKSIGIQEGKSIGIQEGLIKAISLVLKLRFPKEASALSEQLRLVNDVEKLESILARVSTISDVNSIRQVLD